MRTHLLVTLLACAAMFGWGLSPTFADDNQASQEQRASSGQMHGGFQLGDNVSKEMRASHMIGLNVWNPSNQKLAEVKDLIIDTASGKVNFCIVAHGGALGIGEKFIPIPTKYLGLRWDNRNNKHYLAVNLTEDQLRSAPSFASRDWPDFTNQQFVSSIDSYFRTETARTAARPSEVETR